MRGDLPPRTSELIFEMLKMLILQVPGWSNEQVTALFDYLTGTRRGEQLLLELSRVALDRKLRLFRTDSL